ncbi:MAG: aminotransferase class V-fold PLP-dependent enzyme [Puniceicoccales bacterium]|jgi:selenocysteine lyase/cysteine desulfurase|nr:aminotransferase class V-fold PLP-dependent enzyme [Puniceicoccales bacterium]
MKKHSTTTPALSRRQFIGRTAAAAVGAALLPHGTATAEPAPTTLPEPPKKYCPFRAAGVKAPATPTAPTEEWWQGVRARFDLKPEVTFLNAGTVGPIPISVREARARVEREIAEDPGTYASRIFSFEDVRKHIASFVNGDIDEIAITRSTTEGLNIFAFGLDWKSGDEVILANQEHSGAINPFKALEQRNGIKIKWVDLPVPVTLTKEQIIAAYERAITPRTKLIVASHVTYKSGLLLPIKELAELAHAHGLLISVDGAQALAALPVDVRALGVDHYAAPGQKWLLAGTGTGFTWIRKDIQERVRTLTGWYDPQFNSPRVNLHSARRYEQTGQKNVAGSNSIVEAVAFNKVVGPARIEGRIRHLAARLKSGLSAIKEVQLWTPESPTLSAGLTAFTLGKLSSDALVAALRKDNIYVRTIPFEGKTGVRASTHIYNSPEEVDRFLERLRGYASSGLPDEKA